MSGYERPTEKGSIPKKVTFWATVWTPNHTAHGEAVVSPSFGTQAELSGWVRSKKTEGSQVAAWKRTSYGTDFHDESLSTRDEPKADPAKLRALVGELSAMLDAKKRELDRGPRKVESKDAA